MRYIFRRVIPKNRVIITGCVVRQLFSGVAAVGAHAPDLVFAAGVGEDGEGMVVYEMGDLVPDAAAAGDLYPAVTFCGGDEYAAAADDGDIIPVW